MKKTDTAYIITIVILAVIACWGWYSYLCMEMISRGDLKEGCDLASEFTAFCINNERLPDESEASMFATRLHFLRIEDGRYLYECGLYGNDELSIFPVPMGRFQFIVGPKD